MSKKGTGRRVYSTDDNEMERIRQDAKKRQRPVSLPPSQQTAEIRREKKGRGGKTVTVIYGLKLAPNDLKALAKYLKQQCGCGGSAKDNTIVIQGDLRDKIAESLQKKGYKTKFTGG